MLETAKDNHLEDIKNLWKTSFSLTDEYLNFYFKSRYDKNNTLVYTKNNIVVSSAQFFQFDMTFYNKIIKTEYIVGVCTHKEHRNKGYAKHILKQRLKDALKNNIDAQLLIPQENYLFNIYEKFSFARLFDITKVTFKRTPYTTQNVYEYNTKDFNNLYNFYTEWYKSKSCRVIKNIDDFKFTIDEAFIDNSKILIYKIHDNILGFALLELNKKKYIIKEILYWDDDVKESLITKSFEISNAEEIEVLFAGKYENKLSSALGMARVVNPMKLLQIYAQNNPNANFSFKLTDPDIDTNNRRYVVDNSIISVDYVDNFDFNINISQFTQFIFGYKAVGNLNKLLISSDPYMNLMLN